MGNNFFKRDDRDMQFVLKEHLGIQKLCTFERYSHFTMEDFDMVLEQSRRIAENELAPTFQDADRAGCRFEKGTVSVPEGFHRCWSVFKEGGWFALSQSDRYGGQGLPLIIAEAAQEFFMSANFAFGCYSGMGAGNGAMIENFGNEKQKDLFLEKLYTGVWGACMCLTEPEAGSDAHMVSTRAVPDGDYYSIQGTKIFITSGEHDLCENIIHLVIARVEGDPPGAKGVSLFAVPKIWVNEDGSLGEPNDLVCTGIEHKMGMNGSSTCSISYGDNNRCRGHLIGERGMGLAYMFQMVNVARLAVGLESVAFAANIYANALEYAKERVQGTLFGRKGHERVRIVEHADIRRMLMNIKSLTEGMRALVYKTYYCEDISHCSDNSEERESANDRVELFTPLIKAYCSDRIFEIGKEGIQILGGYGFIKEYPIEQYVRDCKILSIWDGTNYIQSLDLVGRKLRFREGRAYLTWIQEMQAFIEKHRGDEEIGSEIKLLEEGLGIITAISGRYADYAKSEKFNLIPLTSTRFLDCCAELAISHLLLEQAVIASARCRELPADHGDAPFYQGKVETARYYVRNVFPNIFGRMRAIELEDMTAVNIAESSL